MKKLLLILLVVGIYSYSFSQKAESLKAVVNKDSKANAGVLYSPPIGVQEYLTGPVLTSNETVRNQRYGTEIVIGKTKYDLQTNRTMQRRLFMLPNNNMIATWTFANSGTPFNDRGTGYNFFTSSNTTWAPYPVGTDINSMTRLESIRTGWPAVGITNNNASEIIISHDFTALILYKLTRATIGSGNWAQGNLSSLTVSWPRVATGGTNNNTVHVLGTLKPDGTVQNGIINPVLYSRSTNGGSSWDKVCITLPGEDATLFAKELADDYDIAARGNVVAVVMGGNYNTLVLFKSTDNGNNWSKKTVWAFPYAPINPDTQTWPDTIAAFDGAYSILIDDNNVVHLWGGVTRITSGTPPAWYYLPAQCGMIYWRDNMNTITGNLEACSNFCWPYNNFIDRNSNGKWDCLVGGWNKVAYNVGGTSMPTGSIDANGNLYVIFQHMSDADKSTFHIYTADTVPYRHLFGIMSTDNGVSWSDAVEVTPFDEGREYVFASSVSKITDDSLRLTYMEDDLPGNSLNPSDGTNPHPSGYDNDIVYLAVPLADFFIMVSNPEKNNSANNNFSLFPNPSREFTNLTFNLAKAGTANISVLNIMGEKVAAYKVDGVSGKNNKQLNTGNLAAGIYMVRIETEGKIFTEKLIKN
ncbi:MAG: T9SS type A sorting domain-containing protein [Bacteroidales bacterium]|nr:T9SS type A sorting domain-containing protein [Bacteroidales bacterium]